MSSSRSSSAATGSTATSSTAAGSNSTVSGTASPALASDSSTVHTPASDGGQSTPTFAEASSKIGISASAAGGVPTDASPASLEGPSSADPSSGQPGSSYSGVFNLTGFNTTDTIPPSRPLVTWPGIDPALSAPPGVSLPRSLAQNQASFGSLDPDWPFNSTAAFTLDALSPMFEFSQADSSSNDPTEIDGQLYNITLPFVDVYFAFVGVGFSATGSASVKPLSDPRYWPLNRTDPAVIQLYSIPFEGQQIPLTKNGSQVVNVGKQNLGDLRDLNLTAYTAVISHNSETDFAFDNATIQIPLKTQAPNFTALQSQVKTVSVLNETNQLNPLLSTSPCSAAEELGIGWELTTGEPVGDLFTAKIDPVFQANHSHLELLNNTELVYTVPSNTTLIEVLGPVGNYSAWEVRSQCYALLNPRPRWWQKTNIPISRSFKDKNATDQTVFLLPIDPGIAHELRIGALGNPGLCPVSAIKTYPYHYDFPVSAEGAATPSTAKGRNTTSIIVGVVVGVGGGLILLGLLAWCLLRRRKQREEREKELLPDPYTSGTNEAPRTKAELAQMAAGADPFESPQPSHDEAAADLQQGASAVREGDPEGGDVLWLPPRYRGRPTGADPSAPSDTREKSHSSSDRSAPAPFSDPALDEKVTKVKGSRPVLKQEYARTFGRPLPQPPQTAGPSTASDLRDEYKRQFGASADSSDEQGRATSSSGPDSAGMDLRDGYKRLFGSSGHTPEQHGESSSFFDSDSGAPDLREEYKRQFG